MGTDGMDAAERSDRKGKTAGHRRFRGRNDKEQAMKQAGNSKKQREEWLLVNLGNGWLDGHYPSEASAREALASIRQNYMDLRWTLVKVIDKTDGAFIEDAAFHCHARAA
jgi:hypothetical protein